MTEVHLRKFVIEQLACAAAQTTIVTFETDGATAVPFYDKT